MNIFNTETKLICTDIDVRKDCSYSKLNNIGFIRTNELHQWYLLVKEGWKKSGLPENEIMSAYLVNMLRRFSVRPEIFGQLKAFNYAEYLFGNRKVDYLSFQDVADMCLQFLTFFPDYVKYRHEMKSSNYVYDLSKTFYQELAKDIDIKDNFMTKAYKIMAESLGIAIIVLRNVCHEIVIIKNSKNKKNTSSGIPMPSDKDVADIIRTKKELTIYMKLPIYSSEKKQ